MPVRLVSPPLWTRSGIICFHWFQILKRPSPIESSWNVSPASRQHYQGHSIKSDSMLVNFDWHWMGLTWNASIHFNCIETSPEKSRVATSRHVTARFIQSRSRWTLGWTNPLQLTWPSLQITHGNYHHALLYKVHFQLFRMGRRISSFLRRNERISQSWNGSGFSRWRPFLSSHQQMTLQLGFCVVWPSNGTWMLTFWVFFPHPKFLSNILEFSPSSFDAMNFGGKPGRVSMAESWLNLNQLFNGLFLRQLTIESLKWTHPLHPNQMD